MNKNKFKEGLSLIELMAVIGIVAILLAITTPIMSGYIIRANKVNVITQSKDVVQYAISSNIDVSSDIKLGDLVSNRVFSDYEGRLDYLQDDIVINTLLTISSDQDALNKIRLKYRKIVEWTGENPYKKSEE